MQRVVGRECERSLVGGEGPVGGKGLAKRKSRWTRSTAKRTARSTATEWRYRQRNGDIGWNRDIDDRIELIGDGMELIGDGIELIGDGLVRAYRRQLGFSILALFGF